MTTSICKHQLSNEYDHTMLQCVRCDLKDEMNKCKTCRINNNKLKKANNRFPDAIVDLINSFNVCKKCVRTSDLINNEPEELNIEEANLWYFVNLNPLPSRTTLNKQLCGGEEYYILRIGRYTNFDSFDFYYFYKNWFNQLWKSQREKKSDLGSMINILRFMFNINGEKYKLEYPQIFNEEFFRDNVYHYLNRITIIND